VPKRTPQRIIDSRRSNRTTSISGLTSSAPAGVTDHGALAGLADDDHNQYLLADGTRTLTGILAVAAGVTVDGAEWVVGIGGSAGRSIAATARLSIARRMRLDVDDVTLTYLHGQAMQSGAVCVGVP
jgi:hypothetical protein